MIEKYLRLNHYETLNDCQNIEEHQMIDWNRQNIFFLARKSTNKWSFVQDYTGSHSTFGTGPNTNWSRP